MVKHHFLLLDPPFMVLSEFVLLSVSINFLNLISPFGFARPVYPKDSYFWIRLINDDSCIPSFTATPPALIFLNSTNSSVPVFYQTSQWCLSFYDQGSEIHVYLLMRFNIFLLVQADIDLFTDIFFTLSS